MDFEVFKAALPSMGEVHVLKADGTEVYGLYKHDVCYVERDGIQRTLQMIVPEMKQDKKYTYPAILYVQGSAWMKQDNYKRLGVMARLAQKGYVTAILQYREIGRHADEMIRKYNIKTSSKDVKVKTLSGGNQQKVVIARELNPEPILDIASQPTRGLDLGAVAGVHDVLMKERERGAAVLFISAELQEVMALSDRIIVLFSGESMGDLDGETADQATIGQMMLGKREVRKD